MASFGFITLCVFVLLNAIEADSNEKSEANEKKPHILLIVADDLGFNDVPWHNKEVVAPNLKDLAKNGVILEQSYVQPICSPTRSALMTGKYPFTIGRQGDVIWPLKPTGLTLDSFIIPQLLKPLGYSTHAVGKWHLGFCKWAYTPTERGFDTFRGYYTGSEDYYSHKRAFYDVKTVKKANNNIPDREDEEKMEGYDFRNNRDVDYNASGTYSANAFSSHVEDLLHSSSSAIPKFIYMAFQSVHSPLEVPDKYIKPYSYIKNRNRRTYLGMVSAMDEAIGKIVKALKDTDHYKDTVIIFTTDNGGPTVSGGNNWPLRGNKTTQWEGGTRGAAFVHSPQLPNPGTVSRNLIHVTDWMSTIVNLAGGLPPTNTDSLDQWPSLVGQSPAPRNEFIYDMVDKRKGGLSAAIRVGDFKLLVGNPGPGDWTPPPGLEDEVSSKRLKFGSMTLIEHKKLIKSMRKNCHKDQRCRNKLYWSYLTQVNVLVSKKIKFTLKNLLKKMLKKTRRRYERSADDKTKKTFVKYFEQIIVDFEDKIRNYNESLALLDSLDIRLYNIKVDPEEKHDLSHLNRDIVVKLFHKILFYKRRYVKPDVPPNNPKGSPNYWGGVWSPGWC